MVIAAMLPSSILLSIGFGTGAYMVLALVLHYLILPAVLWERKDYNDLQSLWGNLKAIYWKS